MDHPTALNPAEHAVFSAEKMAKTTLFSSDHLLVGLNCFEPGQAHALHAHADMDKVYQVVEGTGQFLLEGEDKTLGAGMLLVAPAGVPHGIRNTSDGRLVVMAILAPGPKPKG
ncbi:MAG: cupin domain-containing protein [Deltaproteobacteria bacterium]|nr:cupin domain-containing protein [Deltaproteobacteria bacterium]